MKELSSVSNPIVKAAAELKQKKYRTEQQAFLVEGMRSVEEAVNCGIVKQLFVLKGTKTASARQTAIIAAAAAEGVELYEVTEPVMKKIADTETPQALTAVVARQSAALEELAAAGGIVLVLDRIGDPGNLGTMIRTGEGAGIAGVILSKDTVDLYNPKTIRSTMGSIYRVPHVISESLMETVEELKQKGVYVIATHLRGVKEYQELEYDGWTGVLIGNEGNGLSEALVDLADELVRIPMEGSVESLNAAIAAALFMYEMKRKRK